MKNQKTAELEKLRTMLLLQQLGEIQEPDAEDSTTTYLKYAGIGLLFGGAGYCIYKKLTEKPSTNNTITLPANSELTVSQNDGHDSQEVDDIKAEIAKLQAECDRAEAIRQKMMLLCTEYQDKYNVAYKLVEDGNAEIKKLKAKLYTLTTSSEVDDINAKIAKLHAESERARLRAEAIRGEMTPLIQRHLDEGKDYNAWFFLTDVGSKYSRELGVATLLVEDANAEIKKLKAKLYKL